MFSRQLPAVLARVGVNEVSRQSIVRVLGDKALKFEDFLLVSRYLPLFWTNILHPNSIEIISNHDLWEDGCYLLSFRGLNLVVVASPSLDKILWSWGDKDLERQHQPTVNAKGNIVIFDNGKTVRKYSRILEVDPRTNKIVTTLDNKSGKEFYSRHMGGVEVLANGNWMVTVSNTSEVFEVMPSGEVVWD